MHKGLMTILGMALLFGNMNMPGMPKFRLSNEINENTNRKDIGRWFLRLDAEQQIRVINYSNHPHRQEKETLNSYLIRRNIMLAVNKLIELDPNNKNFRFKALLEQQAA